MVDTNIILLFIPIIIVQFILMIYCLINVINKSTTKYLNKPSWMCIILLINLFGPIAYLILEGGQNDSD